MLPDIFDIKSSSTSLCANFVLIAELYDSFFEMQEPMESGQ